MAEKPPKVIWLDEDEVKDAGDGCSDIYAQNYDGRGLVKYTLASEAEKLRQDFRDLISDCLEEAKASWATVDNHPASCRGKDVRYYTEVLAKIDKAIQEAKQ